MAFTDSRRLTGPNVYFNVPAAVLETRNGCVSREHIEQWQTHVCRLAGSLGWPVPACHAQTHPKGATLAFTAPIDQLYAATEINEWAWQAVCDEIELSAPAFPDIHDLNMAISSFRRMAACEREPELIELMHAAERLAWPVLLDDDSFSVGFGSQTCIWPRTALPVGAGLPKDRVLALPVAMVTGSNGKTTSVRLLAAMARAAGLNSGHNCTDGLFFNGVLIEADDYSGPAGARATLRHPGVQAAILETARGGMLRRGLATDQADVALVTNISEDHFGEYGVFTLDDLTRVKLTVAKGLKPDGTLVLNAGDQQLVTHGRDLPVNVAWFARDWQNAFLQERLAEGALVCAEDNGHLSLHAGGIVHDLGAVADMPLSVNGLAGYNIENMAAAALCAYRLGFGLDAICHTLAHFGLQAQDNPGRLQRWQFGDVRVLLDYAHNPDGMRGFLDIAQTLRGDGRMAVLLGQAGNRENDDIVKLAETVARFNPDFVALKDMAGYERGRAAGEVPALLHSVLLQNGLDASRVHTQLDELQAVRDVLDWAQPGDVLALPVHGLPEREAVQALLQTMQDDGWRAGQALPQAQPMAVNPDVAD
jgi:cyanophycin synthetase